MLFRSMRVTVSTFLLLFCLKFLEKKIGRKLLDIDLGNEFLDLTPKSKATKAKTTRELHRIKKFLQIKRNNQKNERQPIEWEKMFSNCISDK